MAHSFIPRFGYRRQRDRVLLLKQVFESRLYLIRLEVVELHREVGDQLIGVMPDGIHVVAVFIVTTVRLLDAAHLALQLLFQCRVVRFCLPNIRVLGGVGGAGDRAGHALQHS